MGLISIPTISDGTVIDANDVNNPLNTIVNEINGNLNYLNLSDSGIVTSKLADNAITAAKISDANVTSSKLGLDIVQATLSSNFNTTASATFQNTGLSLTLGAAGTWLIFCEARSTTPAVANTWAILRLYNATTSTEISDSRRITHFGGDAVVYQITTTIMMPVVTTTSNNIIRLEIQPSAANVHTVYAEGTGSGTTRMFAVRIG